MSAVTYLYPNGALAPTQAQMDHKGASVHATAVLDSGMPVDLVHNLQFDLAAPVEALQVPIIMAYATGGGADGGCAVIATKDGNTLSLSLLGKGPLTVDIWVFRHVGKPSGFFG